MEFGQLFQVRQDCDRTMIDQDKHIQASQMINYVYGT